MLVHKNHKVKRQRSRDNDSLVILLFVTQRINRVLTRRPQSRIERSQTAANQTNA
jgi:hypothetical protein